MSVREYIGARYVPLFMGEWDNTKTYEPLSVVQNDGNSYTSRQFVPTGIDIANDEYWAETGNFNAQVEAYRQEVLGIANVIPATEFTSENTVKDAIDAITPDENTIDDVSTANQDIFPYPENLSKDDVLKKNYANIITVKEDLSLKSAIAAGLQSTLNVNGNSDFCEAIALFNGYLNHTSDLTYNNAYTATTYEGTFDEPVLCNPADHMIDGKMPIDCATLTTLIGNGVTYGSSKYNNARNAAMHDMYCPTALTTKAYWWWAPHEGANDRTMGFGRVLSDGFAKMLFDAGQLTILDGQSNNIQPGDILFSGTADNRFLGITHCSICVGSVANTMGATIIGESVSVANPVRTIPLSELSLGNFKAKITPNYNGGIKLNLMATNTQTVLTKNVNLNANPYSHTNSFTQTAEPLVIVNNANSNASIAFSATNGTSNINITITLYPNAFKVLFLPLGWSYTLSAAASTNVHICQQAICSDKYLVIPPPSLA